MKKYSIVLAFLLFGCIGGANYDKIPEGNVTIQTIEYEGCEYVYLRRFGSVIITHKGNCKNHPK